MGSEVGRLLQRILDHPGHTTSDEYPTLGENPSDKERADQAWRIIEDMRVMASTALRHLAAGDEASMASESPAWLREPSMDDGASAEWALRGVGEDAGSRGEAVVRVAQAIAAARAHARREALEQAMSAAAGHIKFGNPSRIPSAILALSKQGDPAPIPEEALEKALECCGYGGVPFEHVNDIDEVGVLRVARAIDDARVSATAKEMAATHRMLARAGVAERRLEEALAVLRDVQWSKPVTFWTSRGARIGPSCPVCGGICDQNGHAPDCRLARVLRRAGEAADAPGAL